MSENDNDKEDYEVINEYVSHPHLSFKIIVIGDSGVGKSCLTLRGTKDRYKDCYTPTIGFEFFCFNIRIKNQIVKLQIWDTCGQEVYRSLISSFYKNSSLAIIVYSIDNQESFNNIDLWLDEIKTQTHPDLKLILVGNKSDLEDQRVIQKSTAEELAKEHNFDLFMETSAQSGQNAQLVFIRAAQILLENYKECEDCNSVQSYKTEDISAVSLTDDAYSGNKDNGNKNRRKQCCK